MLCATFRHGRRCFTTLARRLMSCYSDGQILLSRSQLSFSQFNQVLTMLEIGGKIRPLGANH
jgi:hypothetical protein